MHWKVLDGDTNMPEFESFLNTASNKSTDDILMIPKLFFNHPGTSFTFTMYVRNALGLESVLSKSLKVTDSQARPTVSILGPSALSRFRWQQLQLLATASAEACGRELEGTTPITYEWSVYMGISVDVTVVSSSSGISFIIFF